MRTIGILGGIGPQATMDFEARVHRAAQRLVPQRGNTGYPPLVTVYMRHPPVVVKDDETPAHPLTLDPRLLEAATKLGEWADLLAIPSNTPHFFLDRIASAAGCEIVSIVDVTVDELRRRGAGRVGLVGLGVPKIYSERLEQERLEVVTAEASRRDRLDRAIIKLMEGAESDDDRAAARGAVEAVRAEGVDAVVLGCSEIPLLLDGADDEPDLVNPARLLAEATVRRAIGAAGKSG